MRVGGREHLPERGPLLLAARHYHHLHDATVILTVLNRPVQILVALDWVRGRWGRLVMEWACRTARWPFVLRADSPHLSGGGAGGQVQLAASAYRSDESVPVLRRAVQDTTRLFEAGGALLIFPEAYPRIDPERGPSRDEDALLPFQPGFAKFVAHAQQATGVLVPIVPVGLQYQEGERWQVTVRFGAPVYLRPPVTVNTVVQEVEARVRTLSASYTIPQLPEETPEGAR